MINRKKQVLFGRHIPIWRLKPSFIWFCYCFMFVFFSCLFWFYINFYKKQLSLSHFCLAVLANLAIFGHIWLRLSKNFKTFLSNAKYIFWALSIIGLDSLHCIPCRIEQICLREFLGDRNTSKSAASFGFTRAMSETTASASNWAKTHRTTLCPIHIYLTTNCVQSSEYFESYQFRFCLVNNIFR